MRTMNPTCPKCIGNFSKITKTKIADNSFLIRERECFECGHVWYTAQLPETVVQTDSVVSRFAEGSLNPFLEDKIMPKEGN
tara:strand:- start:5554 stop:5796 length:243 start_codon:yes stop_codon:yes gene_type:complete